MNSIKDQIKTLCEMYEIHNYTINDDDSVDVSGDVSIANKSLRKIPIVFNEVSGDFFAKIID
jgi:hypothetical protein